MANTVKVQKGNTIKTVSVEHKKLYINAGWSELKKPTKPVGVSSPTKYGND